MEEEWRDIKDYEGYQVSNKGNVKSLDRIVNSCYNSKQIRKGKILKLWPDKKGYLRVSLSKNGKDKLFFVHRLVAEAFLPNPDNLPEVNHKSEIKTQNFPQNLEWCDRKYNINYGTCLKRGHLKQSTKIRCLDLESNQETIYSSLHEAGIKLNIRFTSIWQSIYKYKRPYKNKYKFSEL